MNKVITAADVVSQLRDGMTIGIGGWGPRRKPMALIREILRSNLKDLTVVAYGGADVGMLCAAGKVKKVILLSSHWILFRWSPTSVKRVRMAPLM